MSDSQRILLSLYLSNNEEDIFGLKVSKKLSLCNKSQFSNKYISTTKLCKPLAFQTLIV